MLVGCVAVIGLVTASFRAVAQPTSAPAGGAVAGLQSHLVTVEGQPTLVVVDPARAVLGVYHVHPSSGALQLKSVRNVSWDLQMLEYNGGKPLVDEVRSGLPR